MFRKLPASGSVAAGNVEAAEVLGLCDKMPAPGASMLPEAVRIQSFAVALEAAAGEAAHTSLRGEISAKGQLTLAEATAFLGRFGQAFKASAPSPAAPTTPYEALVRRVDAGGQFDEFMELKVAAQNRGTVLRFGRFGGLPPDRAPAPASRGPGRPGPTRSARPLGGAVRPTGPAVRRPVARRRTEPDRPTCTAWPRPPLSAAESAPSAPSGSSWHSSASSRRSAAPTPCALSQTRSSACTF